jgi:PIN domain nuclease of toxin-antitoxin system
MTTPLLDTHAWVGWMLGSSDLSSTEHAALNGFPVERRPYLSAISLWEVAALHNAGHLRLRAGFSAWHESLAGLPGIRIEALSGADVEEARSLRNLVDPFDRLIAGTALRLGVPLITRDGRVAKERRVRVVW